VTIFLDLRAGLKEELWAQLLQNHTEQVAIVFAVVEPKDDAIVFSTKDAYLATAADFEIQSEFHVELADEARARIIKRAWDTGTSPVEFHSHPGDCWGAKFSPSDISGFSEYVPHCRWRLRGRPYLAVVVSPAGMDALAWTGTDGKPVGLDAIRPAGSTAIIPTNQTINSLKAEVPKHGPGAF
jgi:proteasome lid subunit RPN8/RPN11